MPARNMDVTKILKDMGVPEVLKKEVKPTLNLASTPEVAPQTSYVSSGLMAAAVFAGGYLMGQKRTSKQDDTFQAIL